MRGRHPNNNPAMLLVLVAIIAAFVGYLVWYNSTHTNVDQTIYSTLLTNIEEGNVDQLRITDQTLVQGKYKATYKKGGLFQAEIVPNDSFWQLLRDKKVTFEVHHSDSSQWGGLLLLLLLPFLFFAALFYFRSMQSGGGGAGKIFSVGKSKAKYYSPNSINVTFKDVAGVVEAKEDLQEVVEFLKNPEKFERLGAKIPRGILLCGAPGNGKTLLAKAVAGEAHCPFYSISGSDFVEVFVGVGASRVRDLFSQARKSAPCIVFIDEIDAVGRQRGVGMGGGNDEREQTLNQLLSEMDGFTTERGAVIVLAATNRPDVLDKALLRPGRFDRTVEVPYPDITSREHILKVHAKGVPLSEDVELRKVARGTPGFSGADLENLINEAALLASKTNKKTVELADFEAARDKLLMGAERKTMVQTEDERRMTAYHEGGHALLNLLLDKTDPFHKVTIIPRGRALGVSMSLPEKDKYSNSKTAMLHRIQVCFGGLIAEKMTFNEQTTGVSSDIRQATDIARDMVCLYGMSDLGPITFAGMQNSYLGVRGSEENYSQATAQLIDQEVKKIMDECYQNAERLLQENVAKLELLATTLLEKETLQAKEVYELLAIEPRKTHNFDDDLEEEVASDLPPMSDESV